MDSTETNKNHEKGGFLPLKIFGKKEVLRKIFPDKSTFNFHYKRIWKKGQEDSELNDDYGYKASLDLRLGNEVYISTKEEPKNLKKGNRTITIKSGEFALLQTYEKIFVPKNMLAFIAIRYSYKKKGLVNISGFHVDPGYEGHITYSVYNAGANPVVLRYGDEIFTIFFVTLTEEVRLARRDVSKSPYLTPKIPSKDMQDIKGPPVSLINLQRRLERTESLMKILISLMITFVGALIVAVITL